MRGEPLRPQPKPVRREKEPKRLATIGRKKAARIAAGEARPGMKRSFMRGPSNTAHSRRPREFGRMSYAHTWLCDVRDSYIAEFGAFDVGISLCDGPREYMHLHLEEGSGVRAPDHQGAIGCKHHHQDIDGKNGGKGKWYVALGRDGQLRLRRRLVERQRARWDALTNEQRQQWDERAAVNKAQWAEARRSAA